MDIEKRQKIKENLKKRLPLFLFLTLCTITFFLASTLLLEDSYKDIFLVIMIWSLPLFIH